jgi:general nucleoside transport system permease protein
MSSHLIVSSVATALVGATAVLIAATGELLTERVGVFNLGIEGIMLMGALGAFAAMDATGSAVLGLLGGAAVGALFTVPFALAVAVWGTDMIMTGLGLTFVGIGLSGQLGTRFVQRPASATVSEWTVPLLGHIPYVGQALFQQPWMVYLAFLLPVAVYALLGYTRHGTDMRAIGESPAAVDALGLRVTLWRVVYIELGAALIGLGGAFLTLGVVHTWLPQVTAGRGWIALALVIFAGWRPLGLIVGACLFGALATLGDVAQALGWPVPSEFFTALPYIGTIAVVVTLAWLRLSKGGGFPWPAALGEPFVRGAD